MIRSLVLFVHVVGVLAMFVGLGLEWLGLDALRRSTARVEALRWLRVSTVVPRFTGIALALTVASGFYLGARYGVLGVGWMRASYAALLVMALVGGPVARAPDPALRLTPPTPRLPPHTTSPARTPTRRPHPPPERAATDPPQSPRSGTAPPLTTASRRAPSPARSLPPVLSHVIRGRTSAKSSDW